MLKINPQTERSNPKQMLDSTLARRLAVEQQLLAEEKWVVEALKNIKKQRNSLQIEKFHMTSELGKRLMKKRGDSKAAPTTPKPGTEMELPFSLDDEVCNGEELNLTVPQHTYFSESANMDLAAIEEFETAEMDYELDINMTMSGLYGVYERADECDF